MIRRELESVRQETHVEPPHYFKFWRQLTLLNQAGGGRASRHAPLHIRIPSTLRLPPRQLAVAIAAVLQELLMLSSGVE